MPKIFHTLIQRKSYTDTLFDLILVIQNFYSVIGLSVRLGPGNCSLPFLQLIAANYSNSRKEPTGPTGM